MQLLILAIVLTELITELSVESVLFERFRAVLAGPYDESAPTLRNVFFRCGYCQSVWYGAAWVFAFRLGIPWVSWPWWLECLVMGLVVHRCSNVWHDVLGWLRHRVHPA